MPNIEVLGVAHDDALASQIVGNLRLEGVPQDAVSVLVVNPHEAAGDDEQKLEDADDQTGKGVAIVAKDAAIGGAVGGTAGVIAGLAAMAIPGIGPVLGSGILLALFGGAGTFVGALSGAFASEKVSNQVVEQYGMALRAGQSLVCVTAQDRDEAKRYEGLLTKYGASEINSYVEEASQPGDVPGVDAKQPGT